MMQISMPDSHNLIEILFMPEQ